MHQLFIASTMLSCEVSTFVVVISAPLSAATCARCSSSEMGDRDGDGHCEGCPELPCGRSSSAARHRPGRLAVSDFANSVARPAHHDLLDAVRHVEATEVSRHLVRELLHTLLNNSSLTDCPERGEEQICPMTQKMLADIALLHARSFTRRST